MKILIDACSWSNQRGFGRYTREIVHAMASQASGEGARLRLLADAATAERVRAETELECVGVEGRRGAAEDREAGGSRPILDLFALRRAAQKQDADVIYYPAVFSYFPKPRGSRAAVTLHDAIAEHHPRLVLPNWRERWAWAAKIRLAVRQADLVMTVSEAASRQIERSFAVDPRDQWVTGEGVSDHFAPGDPRSGWRERRDLGDGPVVLYVGGLAPHKNLGVLLDALALLRDTPCTLAMVGADDGFTSCGEELREHASRLGVSGRVRWIGRVSDDELLDFYRGARVLVLPSLMEGFGLPAAEAMASGCPVIVSTGGSLPEVVGSAGLQFEPSDAAALAAALESVLRDEALAEDLAQRGLQRAADHSWQRAGHRVLRGLRRLHETPVHRGRGKRSPSGSR